MDRRDFLNGAAASSLALGAPLAAHAQSRPKDVLVVANSFGPNSLDIHTLGANRPSYGVSWLVYDRLMSYGKKTLPDGRVTYDRDTLVPELAESWKIAPDGRVVRLRATADGRRLCGRIEADLAEAYARMLEDFDPEVRGAMIRLLGRLGGSFASRVDASGGSCCVVR